MKIVHGFSSTQLKRCVVRGTSLAAYQFSRGKRRKSERSLLRTFDGEINKKQRRRIVQGAFQEFWEEIFSFLPPKKDQRNLRRADFLGAEHLYGALKQGKGVILWESSYLGRRNLAKQILHEHGFSILQVHAENHLGGFFDEDSPPSWVMRHLVKPFFENCEKKFISEIIYLGNSDSLAFTRVLLKRLAANAILCISGDGKAGKKLIPLRHLGFKELFSTGMVSLAKISGATILPLFCFRQRNGQSTLIIEPPIQVETGTDREPGLEKSLIQYIQVLESYVMRFPEMYRNWQTLGDSMGSFNTATASNNEGQGLTHESSG